MVAFSDEVDYLWRGKFTFIKALYFNSRYTMLTLQLVDQFLYFRFQMTQPHSLICARINVYKSVIGQVGMTLIEMILLIRVYALYNQSVKARVFLLAVFIISTALEFSAISIVINTLLGSPACIAPEMSGMVERLYGLGAGFCQFVVFTATIFKLFSKRRTPLMTLVFKEGVVSFILVLILLAVMVVYEILRNMDIRAGKGTAALAGNAVFSWYLALLSIAGSRLILNMRTVVVKHRLRRQSQDDDVFSSQESESVCLTTLTSLDV